MMMEVEVYAEGEVGGKDYTVGGDKECGKAI